MLITGTNKFINLSKDAIRMYELLERNKAFDEATALTAKEISKILNVTTRRIADLKNELIFCDVVASKNKNGGYFIATNIEEQVHYKNLIISHLKKYVALSKRLNDRIEERQYEGVVHE